MDFRNAGELSDQLNSVISNFINRMDMNGRDRELFNDIIGFAFDEGKIRGKEEILLGKTKQIEDGKE